MRIVHVSDCYLPRTGGIEAQVSDLARHQHAAGHEVRVFTATPGPSGGRSGAVDDDGGVQVHRLGTRMPFDLPVNPAAAGAMRRLLTELRPDVVHVHVGVVSPFAFDGFRVAVRLGLPTAVTWHCMLDGVVAPLRLGVHAGGWAGVPAALSAVSHAAAERVQRVFGAPVTVLPNGLDLATWAPAVGAPDTDATGTDATGTDAPAEAGGPLRLVATMRLAPRKRAAALVDLVADAVAAVGPDAVHLDLVGDGPLRSRVEARVERRGLAPVVAVRGRLTRAEIRELYAGSEVFVAPAELEAFGIAALEARAAGLAVIARRGTGIEEFVLDEVDGLIVSSDAAMADAVVRLARDRSLLGAIRSHNRTYPPRFDWSDALAAAAGEYARASALVAGAPEAPKNS